MVNIILAGTASLSTLIHLYTLYHYPTTIPYSAFLCWSLFVSILNHSTTSDVYKWADRCTMAVGFPLTYILCPSASLKLCTIGIVPMYVGAKLSGNVCYHLAAHGLITYVNVAILMLAHHAEP